jgi:hypothetical protein
MTPEKKYPERHEVRVKWEWYNYSILGISTILLWGAFVILVDFQGPFVAKLISVSGLYIDIVGITLATLKTPYYGSFYDGGDVERWRLDEEKKWFIWGMFIIACGTLLQVLGTILQK